MEAQHFKIDSPMTQFIQDFLVKISVIVMGKHCSKLSFEAIETAPYLFQPVNEKELSLIMLWGSKFGTIVLKNYYDPAIIRKIIALNLGKSADGISDELVRGYMSEFYNMFAGFFRRMLENEKIFVGMSLPMSSRGSDEVIYFKQREERLRYLRWTIKSSEGHVFHCSSEIYLNDSAAIQRAEDALTLALAEEKNKKEDVGEVEFL